MMGTILHGNEDWARVVRVAARDGAEQWSLRIPRLNVGTPLLVDTNLYLAACGYVGKLGIASGATIWRHEGLERRGGVYCDFDQPRVQGDHVLFCERVPTRERTPNCLVVQLLTGAIVSGWPPPVGAGSGSR